MVYRVFVEKREGLRNEAAGLLADLTELLQIEGLHGLRVVNRYDVEGIDQAAFERVAREVLSEPQLDEFAYELPLATTYPGQVWPVDPCAVFAVEYLPGQFDQRADSAAQCIQLISRGERPNVRSARVYLLYGDVAPADVEAIKHYIINPVEAREAALELPETLALDYELPTTVATLEGLTEMDDEALADVQRQYGLAMDLGDLQFFRNYFRDEERRDPTITELRVIDTYWSDHCRHTTFHTIVDSITFESPLLEEAWQRYLATREACNRTKPIDLMDLGTIAARFLKQEGQLDGLDESEEINACTVKITCVVDGELQDWLLFFKNETHNHPTEIEPFGGAATCVGGAIRDPLSGRAYVYAAMRVTGAANPLAPVSETIPGKLPQRKIVTEAAHGYSSYGNQIGLATGQVDELYHPGYAAKRMEVGAVLGAAPANNVVRERPAAGDKVVLLGGKTGRDGCGGATGSSKSHTAESLETCGAEVQKGNPPEEKKIQRLFRKGKASRLIKRCNDFGAGGVSVAIGELADGLQINLDAVPRKYDGLDGTELAISESQERMAVVVSSVDCYQFLQLAAEENLEATVVAEVTEEPRLVMRWNGNDIVNLSRAFLDSNGAEKHISIATPALEDWAKPQVSGSFAERMLVMASGLECCSRRGLAEMFDSTIGANTVLAPFGGKHQLTPIQAMAHLIPVQEGTTNTCSVMAWGYNPAIAEKSPFHSAYLAVVESCAKLVASGASFRDVYLSFQEYFGKVGQSPERWGIPTAALLGALRAQLELGVAAIGGKDSMSGTFEDLDVPPTLISFAVTSDNVERITSPEFKGAGHDVILLAPEVGEDGLPVGDSLVGLFAKVGALVQMGLANAVWTPGAGGVAEGIMKMAFGNGIGFEFEPACAADLFGYAYGSFVVELADGVAAASIQDAVLLGRTVEQPAITFGEETLTLDELLAAYEGTLEPVFTCNIQQAGSTEAFTFFKDEHPEATPMPPVKTKIVNPISIGKKGRKIRVLIPAFPGTNCEYDTARVFAEVGASPEVIVVKNLTPDDIQRSVEQVAEAMARAQIVFIPGGFSSGDEPEGSAKFIASFFRHPALKASVTELLEQRDGLMGGICNGFQALIKLGLLPYGRICETTAESPTLTFNTIGRHQSRIVRTRICTDKSPWLTYTQPGEIYSMPISHGEGRFLASDEMVAQLAANGQIVSQYVDLEGNPTQDVRFNPNGSVAAIEGICSPDGRVMGKMGHAERRNRGTYKNVPGNYLYPIFQAAYDWYKQD